MPKSRSTRPENSVVYRHPLMFTSREMTHLYPDYDPKHPKGLAQFEGQRFDRATQDKLGLDLTETPLDGMSRDSRWRLRKSKLQGDGEAMIEIMVATSVDWQLLAKEYAETGRADPKITTEHRTTANRAILTQMTIALEGPYFLVYVCEDLRDFTVEDFTGSNDDDEAATVHELNGEIMPIDPTWLKTLDEDVVDGAKAFTDLVYAGRSPEEEAQFPASALALDDAAETADGAGEAGTR